MIGVVLSVVLTTLQDKEPTPETSRRVYKSHSRSGVALCA